jgi:hypothetical protein
MNLLMRSCGGASERRSRGRRWPIRRFNHSIMPSERKSVLRRLIRWTLIIGGTLAFIVVIGICFLYWALFGETSFRQSSAGVVTAQVLNNTLVPNTAGVVKLPGTLASNSCDGKVYVTVDSTGTTWVLFPTWRGKGRNIQGYLYRSTPSIGPPPAQITVIGPDIGAPTWSSSWQYTVESQLTPNWYRISFDLD